MEQAAFVVHYVGLYVFVAAAGLLLSATMIWYAWGVPFRDDKGEPKNEVEPPQTWDRLTHPD